MSATVKDIVTAPPLPSNVYGCIAAVSAEIAKTGISKDRQNVEQKYKFRGIDDVYNALAPMLPKFGLIIVPRILSRAQTERTTKHGTLMFNVVVEAEFDFICAAHPESRHTARTFGEAMDTADKATNKAMSAAHKYALFQTFCIPTEGDNDADAHTPEPTVSTATPDGYAEWVAKLGTAANQGVDALRAAFKAGTAAQREYLQRQDVDRYDDLVTNAKDVTAEAKSSAA